MTFKYYLHAYTTLQLLMYCLSSPSSTVLFQEIFHHVISRLWSLADGNVMHLMNFKSVDINSSRMKVNYFFITICVHIARVTSHYLHYIEKEDAALFPVIEELLPHNEGTD